MISQNSNRYGDVGMAVAVGAMITILWTALTWRYGFDFADEGYYWYGSQRLLRGQIPMRDFLSYDIGRYVWGAALMRLMGDDGIIGVRMSAAVFRVLSVVVGVLLALRAADGRLSPSVKLAFAALTAVLLNLWVFPYYKVFDFGISILLLAMLVLMVSRQTARAWFGAGIILGLAAVIGRNHGMYGALAALLLLAFLLLKHPQPRTLFKPAVLFIVGVVVGFSPNFIFALLFDGFTAAFITTLRDLIQSGSANIGLPIPWPWTLDRSATGLIVWSMDLVIGLAFMALLLVPLGALLMLARRPLAQFRPIDQVMLAAAMCGLGYAHYAYSRSDLTHLSHSIVGVLLILLCLGVRAKRPVIAAIILLGVSFMAFTQETPFLAKPILHKKLATMTVNGTDLYVFPGSARRLEDVEKLFATYPQGRTSFLALPNAPGLHAIMKSKMQIWEIYALSKRPAAFEQEELARLDAAPPEVILLSDHGLDKHEDMRYSLMHPLTYQWINEHYRRVEPSLYSTDENWQAYVLKH